MGCTSVQPILLKIFCMRKEQNMYCTVKDIRGDYAIIQYEDSGIESEVALALLPFGIDVGDKLRYENYEFEIA